MALAAEGGMAASGLVREALVVLGAAAVVIPLFQRLRVRPVLGFMLIGVAVGLAAVLSRANGSPNGAGDACTQFFSGETKDFTVTIAPPPACRPTSRR